MENLPNGSEHDLESVDRTIEDNGEVLVRGKPSAWLAFLPTQSTEDVPQSPVKELPTGDGQARSDDCKERASESSRTESEGGSTVTSAEGLTAEVSLEQ